MNEIKNDLWPVWTETKKNELKYPEVIKVWPWRATDLPNLTWPWQKTRESIHFEPKPHSEKHERKMICKFEILTYEGWFLQVMFIQDKTAFQKLRYVFTFLLFPVNFCMYKMISPAKAAVDKKYWLLFVYLFFLWKYDKKLLQNIFFISLYLIFVLLL